MEENRKSLDKMEYGDIFVSVDGTPYMYVCKHKDGQVVYNLKKKEFYKWYGIEYKYLITDKKD